MLDERFVYVAAILNVTGSTSYVIATLRGRTKPNRVTWFVWSFAPMVAFGAEVDEGVGAQSVMTFMVGFGPALIFLASFINPHSSWRLTPLDILCGILSAIAIGVWLFAGHGLAAIALTITADALAGFPTVIKAYRHPQSESPWVYWLAASSASITLLTVDDWNLAHYGFPVYILVSCALIASQHISNRGRG